jgi:hypothetical protein
MKIANIYFYLLLVCILFILNPFFIYAASSETPISNFQIISVRGEWRGPSLYVIGEVKNIGAIPGGPKLEVIVRDSNGFLIDSAQFWPNSTVNILPGASCGVKHPVSENKNATKIELKVISVNSW